MAFYTVNRNVGLIYINHPPVNSINAAVRQSVYQYTKQAEKDDQVSKSQDTLN